MPQASTRTRISPGPMSGIGISSTFTMLWPRYTAACIVAGMALTSESAVGKKIPQGSGGPGAATLQPDQFREPGTRMAQTIPKNMHCSEVPVGTQRLVEVIRHIFACQIGYYLNARERQAQGFGSLGDAARFHFDSNSTLVMQSLLLRSRGGDPIY